MTLPLSRQALSHALLAVKPEKIIRDINASSLRGRGGAGFVTGRRWELTRHARGGIKYVIVNGDEGDPEASIGFGGVGGEKRVS